MKRVFPKKFSTRLMAMPLVAGMLPVVTFGIGITPISRDLPMLPQVTLQKGLDELKLQNVRFLESPLEERAR